MRITIVGPVYPYRGGIAHYTALLAKKMAGQGHEVQVVSFHRQYPKRLYPGKTDRDPSAKAISTDALYLIDSLNPLSWIRTAGVVKKHQPDLVLFMWWSTFWTLVYRTIAVFLRSAGIRVAFLIHNVLPHEAKFYDRWLGRFGLGAAQSYLVQTSEQRKRLLSLIPNARVLEAPHPVYDMFRAVNGTRESARKRFGFAEGDIVLLFFGIIRPYKGLMVLLEAVGLLKAEGIPVHLLTAGEFWDAEEPYRQKCRELGIEDWVRFSSRYIENEEVPDFFSAADVFVAPYVGGTQSGAINVAVSFHLPIVLTDKIVESVDREIQLGHVVVPSGDAVALAEGIKAQIARRNGTGYSGETGERGVRGEPGERGVRGANLDAERTWYNLIAAIEKL